MLPRRLEALSEPGGVTLSDDAYRQVRDRLDLPWQDGGEHEVKNITRPIQVWHTASRETSSASESAQDKPTAPPDIPSIAVLPFDNLSGDPEQEYFSDGITEDILTELSPGAQPHGDRAQFFVHLQGPGRSTSNMVGRELGVRYVLEGSIRKAGNRVRVTAQLIEAASGGHIWAERYDRDLEDLFAVQDEITFSISGALVPEILESEQARAQRVPPKDLTAQDLVYQGLWHFYQYNLEAFARAQERLGAALEREPTQATAHAILSWIEVFSVIMGWHKSPPDAVQVAFSHANRALELERNNRDAHLALSGAFLLMRQWDQAFEACRTAIKLTPSFAIGYNLLGVCEVFAGDARAAVDNIQKAMQLSPRDPFYFMFESLLGVSYYRLGQYDAALEWSRNSIRNKPDYPFPHFDLAAAFGQLGRGEDAKTALARALQVEPEPTAEYFRTAWMFKDPADLERLLDGLRKAGMQL